MMLREKKLAKSVFHEPFRCDGDLCDYRLTFALGNDYLISSATIFKPN